MNETFPAKFMSLRAIAQTGLLPESVLRRFAKQKKLPGFYTGRKYLVNTDLLTAMLEDPTSIFNQDHREAH
jgi:hypothetical protein